MSLGRAIPLPSSGFHILWRSLDDWVLQVVQYVRVSSAIAVLKLFHDVHICITYFSLILIRSMK
jgi:hypothetical protein